MAHARDGREEILFAVGGLYLAARDEQEGSRNCHGERWHDRRRGVFSARPFGLRQNDRKDHVQRDRGGVQYDCSSRAWAISGAASQRRIHQEGRKTSLHIL